MCLLQIRSQLVSEFSVGIGMSVQSPSVCADSEDDPVKATCGPKPDPGGENDGGFGIAPSPAQPASPKCLFYNSFFYALLRNSRGGYCYANVERWGRRHNMAEMDYVFFPINVSNSHWCLAVVEPKMRRIRYFDSLGGINQHCLDLLERYMRDEGEKRGIEAFTGDWDKENIGPPDIPAQTDGCSCGVFVCAFADCLSMDRFPAGFAQRDMPTIRAELYKLLTRCNM
jgi:sentrin-specific protease 1